jgi:hypothetical protein
VNLIYKKLRKWSKKLDKIGATEQKVKDGEIQANQEQLDMIASKAEAVKEMKEQEAILALYKEAFPDNPAFKKNSKKQKAKKEEVKHEAKQESPKKEKPQVDVNKHIQDALSCVADLVALHGTHKSLHKNFSAPVSHLVSVVDEVAHANSKDSLDAAKDKFVSHFTELASKSHSQVGHTGITFSEIDVAQAVEETMKAKEDAPEPAKKAKKERKPRKETETKENEQVTDAKKEEPKEVTGTIEAGEASGSGEDNTVEEEHKRATKGKYNPDRKQQRKMPKNPKNEDDDGFQATSGPSEFEKHYGRRGGFRGSGRGHDRGRGWQGATRGGAPRGRGGRGRGGKQGEEEPRKHTEGNAHEGKGEVRTPAAE